MPVLERKRANGILQLRHDVERCHVLQCTHHNASGWLKMTRLYCQWQIDDSHPLFQLCCAMQGDDNWRVLFDRLIEIKENEGLPENVAARLSLAEQERDNRCRRLIDIRSRIDSAIFLLV